MQAKDRSLISVVVPVYNEAENIRPCLLGLWDALKDVPHEILICYDHDGDTTLPAIAGMADRPRTVRLVKNDLGKGVAYAPRAGFQAAQGDVVVSFMADLSDPPKVILAMAEAVRKGGAQVVSGSRFMKGGAQVGGPLVKRMLSRLAGLSLHWLAGVGTVDATTNFRAYSGEFLRQVTAESRHGFEVGLELTVKAHLQEKKVCEVPSIWQDRTVGQSRFKIMAWLPSYLHWYIKAMAGPLLNGMIAGLALVSLLLTQVSWQPFIYIPHLDVSWNMVMHYAFENGKRFGEEIVFSYGPYGFVYGPFIYPQTALYYPSTFKLVLLIQSFFGVVMALALRRLIGLYLSNPWKALGWLAAIALLNFNILICLGFLLNLLYWVDPKRPVGGVNVLLTLALALASLIKFNYFMLAAWILAVMGFEEVFRWRRWPWLPLIYVVGLLGFWMNGGQNFSGLVQYIWNSVRLSAGYNEAMVWGGRPAVYMLPYLGAAGLLLALLALDEWGRFKFWGFVPVVSLLGACFLIFKAAFIRHEEYHEMIANLGAPTLVLLYLPVLWQRFQKRLLRGALVTLLAMGVLGINLGISFKWGWMFERIYDQARGAHALLTGKANLEEIYTNRQRDVAAHFPFLPSQGSVDLYSYEQAYIIGPHWNYAPRPVFHSYSAFTPALAELNAQHLRSSHAADTIFFSVQPIDARYPSLEDSLSWPELLARYDVCETVGPYIRLQRAKYPRSASLEPVAQFTARFGEDTPIQEGNGGPLWAEVEIKPTVFKRVVSLFYKAPLPTITVNGQFRFRLIPSMAKAGFLLSPLVLDVSSFEKLASNPRDGVAIKSIRIEVEKDHYFQPEIQMRLFRLRVSPQQRFAHRIFESSKDVRWRMPATGAPVDEFISPEQISIFQRQGKIVLKTRGPEAYLLLPDFPMGKYFFVVMRIELTSLGSTMLSIAYQTENGPGYSSMRTVWNPLSPGRNTIFLAIPGAGLKGRLLLYPGSMQGEYVLHSLEVRGAQS